MPLADSRQQIASIHAFEMLHSVLAMGSYSAQAFPVIDIVPLGATLSRLDYTIQRLQSALKQGKTDSEPGEDGRRISRINSRSTNLR
ncbi:hypothetical protein F5B18DRAFT_137006 [Nemania serpens]|nr:hypothetical protein F5B18DRAFT_137006 [Nemania serpens]